MRQRKQIEKDRQLKIAFRHTRGASKTVGRIIRILFPEEEVLKNTLTPDDFEKLTHKERCLASYAEGIDYLTERLLRLVEQKFSNDICEDSKRCDADRDN